MRISTDPVSSFVNDMKLGIQLLFKCHGIFDCLFGRRPTGFHWHLHPEDVNGIKGQKELTLTSKEVTRPPLLLM